MTLFMVRLWSWKNTIKSWFDSEVHIQLKIVESSIHIAKMVCQTIFATGMKEIIWSHFGKLVEIRL